MKNRWLFLGISILILTLGATAGFSQASQTRIPQQVVINGQTANGAYVTAPGGGIQSFTCPTPQQYVTPDGSSQGWACYEQATGTWLLNAVPPAQVQAGPVPVLAPVPAPLPQQPTVIYQQPPATVIYQAPPPTVVYTTPVYTYPRPVIVAPAYPSSVILGSAAINAAGRIAAAAIYGGHHTYVVRYHDRGNHWGRRW